MSKYVDERKEWCCKECDCTVKSSAPEVYDCPVCSGLMVRYYPKDALPSGILEGRKG